MTPQSMLNMSGTWLGTYWQYGQPTRFEASLVQGGQCIQGRILDAGYLGEACLNGALSGSHVAFTKRYLTTSPSPIHYVGTLSTEGDYVYGNWWIGAFDSGRWEAYRTADALALALAKFLEKSVTAC